MNAPQLHHYDLAADVVAFSTTRHGGFSTGNYGDFNINEYCGDDASAIGNNRRALAELLGIREEEIIMPHQTHGVEVRQIAPDLWRCPQI